MKRTLLALKALLFLASLFPLFGQDLVRRKALNLPDKEGSLVLGGSISNSVTGAPVNRASVSLTGWGTDFAKQATTFTDISGHFEFDRLPSGNYRVATHKPLFDWMGGESINLTESKLDMRLRLVPFGSIEGTAVDAGGEPLQGVSIQALTTEIQDGSRIVSLSRSVATDDLGRYRLWNLRPGKYYLKAAGRSGGTRLFLGERTPSFDSHECFNPVYYLGAATLPTAQPVNMDTGGEVRADFSLPMRPAYKVRGTVANFEPYLTARFDLLMGGEDVAANRVALNSANGNFEIQDVVPGAYVLRITQGEGVQRKRAELKVVVTDAAIEGVNMPLAAGTDIEGLGRFPQPVSGERQLNSPVGVRCQASFHPTEIAPDFPGGYQIPQIAFSSDSPSFEVKNLLPGKYNVDFSCFGGYVVSALAGTQDLLVTHALEIQPGTPPVKLGIDVKNDSGWIAVKVKFGSARALVKVVFVPRFSTGTVAVQQVAGGDFQSGPLAPGDYLVFAFLQEEEVEYRSLEAIRGWRGGFPVHVDVEQVANVELSAPIK